MRSGRFVGAPETSKERAEWRRLHRKNLNILGRLKRKEWPQYHKESNWQVRQSRLCQEKNVQNRQSRVPDHEGGESYGGQKWHLDEREGDRSGSMKKKGWTPR